MPIEERLTQPFCKDCGRHMIWGKFAYKQEICDECFEERVRRIASNTKTIEDSEIVLHMLAITKEVFRRKL